MPTIENSSSSYMAMEPSAPANSTTVPATTPCTDKLAFILQNVDSLPDEFQGELEDLSSKWLEQLSIRAESFIDVAEEEEDEDTMQVLIAMLEVPLNFIEFFCG